MGQVSPPKDSVPQAALTRCLRELPNYLVLRNEDDLFGNLQRGGDVDLLVGNLELAERTLIRHLGPPVRIIRSSYVTGYSYDWGHIDLLPTLEWRGAGYLRTQAVLAARRLSASGRPVPRIAHEALNSWLTNLLFAGFFKERYAAEIRKAVEVDGDAFRQTLTEVAGKKWGRRLWQAAVDGRAEISAEWTPALRRVVWWRACFRSPMRTIQRSFAFVIGELRLRYQPAVPWIAILGSDDRGKASLVNEIVHRFATCSYTSVKAFDWRPRFMAGAGGAEPVTDPTGRPARGSLGPGWRRLVLAAGWLAGYWTQWVHLRAKGYVLVFHGKYFDLILDPARDRDEGGWRLVRALCRRLPKPDLIFWLDSEPTALGHGKQESPRSSPVHDKRAYRPLAGELPAGHVLSGSLPLSVLVGEVQRLTRAWMLDRSVASLGGVQAPPRTAAPANAQGSSAAPTVLGRGGGGR